MKITIIGGGNLGCAIALGLVKSNYIAAENITVTRRNLMAIKHLQEMGMRIMQSNHDAVQNADVVILAIKPFQIQEVIENATFKAGQIVISVVTGVWLKDIRQWLGKDVHVFRAMPNTAIAIQQSMTCISFEEDSQKHAHKVEELFEQLGKVIVIDEKLMDAATVLGACGTAFAMRYIRASIQGGIQIGFSSSQASFIVAQTVNGAAELLLKNNSHPEQEIDKVTTPRGCTIAGLNELEHQGFSSSLIKGLMASYDKII